MTTQDKLQVKYIVPNRMSVVSAVFGLVVGAASLAEAKVFDDFVRAARTAYRAETNGTAAARFRYEPTWFDDRPSSRPAADLVKWLPVWGVRNVRDIGGWNGLARGRVIRGAALDGAGVETGVTKRGRLLLKTAGVRTELDLRGADEAPEGASRLGPEVRFVRAPVTAYEGALKDPAAYAAALRVFADAANYPVYVHSKAGADRTGTLVFLLEGLCGAAEEDLVIDYELSSFSAFGRRHRAGAHDVGFGRFLAAMKALPGATMGAKVEGFVRTRLGLGAAEVAAIRAAMAAPKGFVAPCDAFLATKPGAVKPTGWLREWALLSAKGATGRMEEVDGEFRKAWRADFTPRGKKLHWAQGTWSCEGGAYWFDGLVRLAYQLDDPDLKALAKRRLDPVLDRMTETPIGFCWWLDRREPSHFDEVFASSDWMVNWVAGIFTRPMAAWYSASGDPRAARALDCALGDAYWNRGFSRSRDVAATPGSVISIPSGALEAYRATGSAKIADALETYARDYAAHPDRETYGPPPFAGIEETMNLKRREQQALKMPLRHGVVAQESLLSLFSSARVTRDAALASSWTEWMHLLDRRARLPYGALVMDEEWGHPGPRRGTETCALAAELWARLHYLAALGEADFADDVERGFFNAAPAAVTRDWHAHVYFQTPNRLAANDAERLSVRGHGRRQVNYEAKHDPLCCTAGLNRLVPEYVQAMWMTTADGGVAAALYGPCTFETDLAGGRFAAEEKTDYPFGETVEIAVTAAPGGTFPLAVRVPGWCGAQAEIAVNGVREKGLERAGFVRLVRTWKAGDTVRLRFPMAVRVETATDADETRGTFSSVLAGPLLFAKGFAEKTANEPAEKTYLPSLDTNSVAAAKVVRAPLAHPWNWPLDAPAKVTVKDAEGRPLELVPYGCTKFRAAMLRTALAGADRTAFTARLQAEIDAAAARGGGRVTVPAGTHPCGTLRLKSGVELHVPEGATLLGGGRSEDYDDVIPERYLYSYEGMNPYVASRKAFIYAENAENVAITGKGTIHGSGQAFFDHGTVLWERFWAKPDCYRVRSVVFVNCRNVRFEDTTYRDASVWTMWLRYCENVTVSRINVDVEQKIINSDGIDFDGCRHVRVGDSRFHTGDDSIVQRAIRDAGDPERVIVCEDVVVSNCVLESACNGVRIGCPSDDVVRDALFKDIVFRGQTAITAEQPRRYLTAGNTGRLVTRSLVFENWRIERAKFPLDVWVEDGVTLKDFGHMTFRNFEVTGEHPLKVARGDRTPVRDMWFENVRGSIAEGTKPGADFRRVDGLVVKDSPLLGANRSPGEDRPYSANVMDYGAKGDGVHDDTPAIQAAIDAVAANGGGKVYFPFTKGGYRLASPAKETVNGLPCRSQLYLPAVPKLNIALEGEMPGRMLHAYMVQGLEVKAWDDPNIKLRFGVQHKVNTRLVSDWKPPEEHDPAARPWAMISALPTDRNAEISSDGTCGEPMNNCCVTIQNLEFRAYLDKERMYAVQSGANFNNCTRVFVRDSQFALNDSIGDATLGKEIRPSPCPTAGLIMGQVLCDEQILHHVAIQGFRYGIVFGEHTYGTFVSLHNLEEGLVFSRSQHLNTLDFVISEHVQRIVTMPQYVLFRRALGAKPTATVTIRGLNIETGLLERPKFYGLEYGVYDPGDSLRGSVEYFFPWEKPVFPVLGAKNFRVRKYGEE